MKTVLWICIAYGGKSMDLYCIWWKREDACRSGNKEVTGSGIFIV